MAPTTTAPNFRLPTFYSLFFLVIEPISALVGAYFAHFQPAVYLGFTYATPEIPYPDSWATTSALPAGVLSPQSTIPLSQLANLYLLFALNEALVLRATSDLRVWRTLLVGLLIADLGHLYSVRAKGPAVYWVVTAWNPMDWGNIGFVYLGALTRCCFLLGVGLGGAGAGASKSEAGEKMVAQKMKQTKQMQASGVKSTDKDK